MIRLLTLLALVYTLQAEDAPTHERFEIPDPLMVTVVTTNVYIEGTTTVKTIVSHDIIAVRKVQWEKERGPLTADDRRQYLAFGSLRIVRVLHHVTL